MIERKWFAAGILFFVLSVQSTAVTVNNYTAGSSTFNGTKVVYRLFTLKNLLSETNYPLVITMHGVGECGDDNQSCCCCSGLRSTRYD